MANSVTPEEVLVSIIDSPRAVTEKTPDTLWNDVQALDYPATDADPNDVWAFVMFNQPRLAGVNDDE
tara:strand:+ start:765 stop:965 length:201 start_codon:yes stop_codon:yes gene_type:complete